MSAPAGRIVQRLDGALIILALLLPVVVSFSNALAQSVAAALWACWLVLAVYFRAPWPAGRTLPTLIALWLGVCLLSAVLGTDVALGLRTFSRKTLDYTLVALAMAQVGAEPGAARRIVRWAAWGGTFVVFDGLLQWWLGHDVLRARPRWGHRLTGPLDNPNNFGTYLVMMSPLQWWAMGQARRWPERFVLLLGVLAIPPLLVQTDSRSSWLAFGIAVSVLIALTGRWRALAVGLVALAVAVWRWRPFALSEAIDLSPGRWEGWLVSWRMFLDHPWIGIGLGTFMANYMRYPLLEGAWPRPQYAHNCFLQILAETGVAGLITFVALVGWVCARGVHHVRTHREHDSVVTALIASLAAFLVGAIFDTGLYSLPIAFFFWWLLGLVVGATSFRPQR